MTKDPGRHVSDRSGKVQQETRIKDRIAEAETQTVAAGGSAVIDCGGCLGIVAIFAGTCTYTPCDSGGNVMSGASGASFTSEVVVSPPPWRWLKIEPVTTDAYVSTI